MAFRLLSRCLFSVLCFRVFMVTAMCGQAPKGTFLTEPATQMVREGDNASFTCSVPNFDPNVSSVSWDIIRDVYDKTIVEKFDGSKNILFSTLVLHSIGKETQFFRCMLWINVSGSQDKICYFSNRARTIVQHFPSKSEVS